VEANHTDPHRSYDQDFLQTGFFTQLSHGRAPFDAYLAQIWFSPIRCGRTCRGGWLDPSSSHTGDAPGRCRHQFHAEYGNTVSWALTQVPDWRAASARHPGRRRAKFRAHDPVCSVALTPRDSDFMLAASRPEPLTLCSRAAGPHWSAHLAPHAPIDELYPTVPHVTQYRAATGSCRHRE